MYCPTCRNVSAYNADATCVVCGKLRRLTGDDFLGDSLISVVSESRPQQIEFSQAVEQAIIMKRNLVAEAGTGVGKTFAALLPALMSGDRVVVSTATKALQAQYMEELSVVTAWLKKHGIEKTYALLKGKANYVCPLALDEFLRVPSPERRSMSAAEGKELAALARNGGDVASLGTKPTYWDRINAADCQGASSCPALKGSRTCSYIAARSCAQDADVIVANHALVGIDIMLDGALLPRRPLLLLDEAHRAREYFVNAFSEEFSAKRVLNFVRKIEGIDILSPSGLLRDGFDLGAVTPLLDWVTVLHKKAETALDQLPKLSAKMFNELEEWDKGRRARRDDTRIGAVQKKTPGSISSKYTLDIVRQCGAILHFLRKLLSSPGFMHRWGTPNVRSDKEFFAKIASGQYVTSSACVTAYLATTRLRDAILRFTAVLDGGSDNYTILFKKSFDKKKPNALLLAPLELGPILKDKLFPSRQVVAYSATLSFNGTFDLFRKDLGFPDGTEECLVSSPFDYDKNALLYLPSSVDAPPGYVGINRRPADVQRARVAKHNYYNSLSDEIVALTNMTQGRAFVLFTSREDMVEVHGRVADDSDLTLIMQSDTCLPEQALRLFHTARNPVLFGLKSFWEGVSVQGDQLQLVIIAKLSFPFAGDLLRIKRKERRVAKDGVSSRDAFNALDVPVMVQEMKQAAGRLIRNSAVQGVVAILDRRAHDKYRKDLNVAKRYGGKLPPGHVKSYGTVLCENLPFRRFTSDPEQARAFFKSIGALRGK